MRRKEKKKSELFEWSKAVVIALLVAFVVRTFIFTPIVVDGKSMNPTLNNEDRMIVTKIGKLERFDIIVFHANEKEDYIKRIIGLPGDKLEYKNDVLYINGKAYEEKYLNQEKKRLKEELGEDVLLTENFTLEDYTQYKTVPDNTLFVMGDNRRDSKDSRQIGVIPIDKVLGTTKIVFWPISDIKIVKEY